MPLIEPAWWYGKEPQWQTTALKPLAQLYGSIAVRRFARAEPYRARLPVICAGNFTAGGTGKTPLCLALADIVRDAGHETWFLSRGYGGRLQGPVRVNPATHSASDVGDEPLLLARKAATVIARDRRLGAGLIERDAPANAVIILDDGLQNPSLAKELSIAAIDGGRGLGNGMVIPAGPLRAPIGFQTGLVNAVIVMGAHSTRTREQLAAVQRTFDGPVLHARAAPAGDTTWLKGARVIAYAGIANPERFFTMLEGLGAHITGRVAFSDHHAFSEADAAALITTACQKSSLLVTTEKDFARLSAAAGALADLKARSKTLPIKLRFDDGHLNQLTALIAAAIKRRP